MKTKEFIKKVEELGYDIKIGDDAISIMYNGCIYVLISSVSSYTISTYAVIKHAKELFELCIEYAKTPIEEREDNEYEDEESIRIENFYNHIGERRYRIIRLETGEVHDGNSYGYKSVDSALKAYSYIRKYLS